MVETEDGKNCGVSAATTNPWSAPRTMGLAGLSEMPTIVIPGNDNTHSSESGRTAHRMIPGAEIHDLGLEDEDVPLIPYPDWAPYEPEITDVLTGFMARH